MSANVRKQANAGLMLSQARRDGLVLSFSGPDAEAQARSLRFACYKERQKLRVAGCDLYDHLVMVVYKDPDTWKLGIIPEDSYVRTLPHRT